MLWWADPPASSGSPAFGAVYSPKVLKAMRRIRGPRKKPASRKWPDDRRGPGPERRNRREPGPEGRNRREPGALTASKSGRRAFLMKRIQDPKIRASELRKVATELLGLISDHRDFSMAVDVLSRRRQHDLMDNYIPLGKYFRFFVYMKP